MLEMILWFLVILILGWAVFPLLYMFFPHLPDRGYGLSKPAGLLLFGYLYWISVSFKLLPNKWTGAAGIFILVILAGVLFVSKAGWETLYDWFKTNFRHVITTELVFIFIFAFIALMRAANPDIVGTEKPMEMAFINAILRSPSFPPHDPWLSGYAISYYYFGYVMVAGLIRLTGVISGVGFNLAVALWFAMAGVGAFSITLNILNGLDKRTDRINALEPIWKKTGWALLAPLFLIFTGNWQGLLEVLHAMGALWKQTAGIWQSTFWKWLDIQELVTAPSLPFGLIPERASGIWWWRASRVLQDYDLVGNSKEIIDEFPFFSLYLGDLHPHILAMPFVFLACGFGLEFYRRSLSDNAYRTGLFDWVTAILSGVLPKKLDDGAKIPLMLFWGAALLLGGLSFLNTWDFPIYVGLVSAAIVLGRYLSNGWNKHRVLEFFEMTLSFGLAGVCLFIPFYLGFSSQAGGILPSLAFFTRGAHFWVMFGVLLVPIFIGLMLIYRRSGGEISLVKGFQKTSLLLAIMWGCMVLLGFLLAISPVIAGALGGKLATLISSASGQFFNLQGSALLRDLLFDTTLKRIISSGTWLTIGGLLALVWSGVLWLRTSANNHKEGAVDTKFEKNTHLFSGTYPFVLLLIAIGIALTLFPEFFYLRDQFGWRMNTIFKFYYQAWILWSIAAAVSCYLIWQYARGALRWISGFVVLFCLFAGLIYPIYGIVYRFQNINPSTLTLNGNAHIAKGNPDEAAAIQFLSLAPEGIVAEAIGGSYSGYGRISTQTGLVTVLGWPGHESQWRGGAKEIGNREDDIRRLYQTKDWQEALAIIQNYQIKYIYLGWLENNLYNVSMAKFESHLVPAYQNNSTIIFEVPGQLINPNSMN